MTPKASGWTGRLPEALLTAIEWLISYINCQSPVWLMILSVLDLFYMKIPAQKSPNQAIIDTNFLHRYVWTDVQIFGFDHGMALRRRRLRQNGVREY